METTSTPDGRLVFAGTAAASLLALLCALTAWSGTSQQWFEWAQAPGPYAEALVAHASWIRTIIAIDDVFIAAYVSATVLFAHRLRASDTSVLPILVLVGGVVAGVLDLEENHHLLGLTRLAERDVAIPLDAILHRATWSQLKWMIGHVAFFMAGLSLPGRTPLERALRVALVGFQLPIGALVFAVEAEPYRTALVWVRYASLISGFLGVGMLFGLPSRARDVVAGDAKGAPA